MKSQSERDPLPQGSLDLLILRTLLSGAKHGYAIARHLKEVSGEVILVEEGSLYPALHRMERRGWVKSDWGPSESNRRAKYYQLSAMGRKQLEIETEAWRRMQAAVSKVLTYQPSVG